ncbi:MAG: tocopherol cyclase family protein [Bacilli bacterium]
MNKSDLKRNGLMLSKRNKKGYDWWWHSFTAVNEKTGKEQPFYIEFYVTNPGYRSDEPQLSQNSRKKKKPCYVMINVGTWGEHPRQIHNFYSVNELKASRNRLDISVGNCTLTETHTSGKVSVSKEDAKNKKELMSDFGTMEWDLQIDKKIAFNVGYGANSFFRWLNCFSMFWHAEGMKTLYEGYIILDGEKYLVSKDKSYGYADKNWGRDFTSPWVWISSCDIYSETQKKQLNNSAFDIGGGCPIVFGIPLKNKLLGQFTYEGNDIEFNFSKFWKSSKSTFVFSKKNKECIQLDIVLKNKKYELICKAKSYKKENLFINYESPKGEKKHNHLWNTGNAFGTLVLQKINRNGEKKILDIMTFKHAGCEFGKYDK